jgi:predicted  nucleic acid-binding Zn-ribbon protein
MRLEIPLVDFYRMCFQKALRLDYHIFICLIARYAESPEIYEEIKKIWSSFHDLTGSGILFIFAGDEIQDKGYENYRHANWWDNDDHYTTTSEYGEKYSNSAVIVSQYKTVNIENFSWSRITSKLKTENELSDNHTLQVSQLRDFLAIPENDIPCLHIMYLQGNEVKFMNYINLVKNTSIYQLIKNFCIEIKEDKLIQIIDRINALKKEIKIISTQLSKLKNRISYLDFQIKENQRKIEQPIENPSITRTRINEYYENNIHYIDDQHIEIFNLVWQNIIDLSFDLEKYNFKSKIRKAYFAEIHKLIDILEKQNSRKLISWYIVSLLQRLFDISKNYANQTKNRTKIIKINELRRIKINNYLQEKQEIEQKIKNENIEVAKLRTELKNLESTVEQKENEQIKILPDVIKKIQSSIDSNSSKENRHKVNQQGIFTDVNADNISTGDIIQIYQSGGHIENDSLLKKLFQFMWRL